jgi:hypothetical protein
MASAALGCRAQPAAIAMHAKVAATPSMSRRQGDVTFLIFAETIN